MGMIKLKIVIKRGIKLEIMVIRGSSSRRIHKIVARIAMDLGGFWRRIYEGCKGANTIIEQSGEL